MRAAGSSALRRPRGTAAPSDGLAKAKIAGLIGVEVNALTAVIKQLKESGQIKQLGAALGARYVLSELGRARLEQEEAG